MRVQSILYPEGSDPRCKKGEAGKELKKAQRHKNKMSHKKALKAAKYLVKHEREGMRHNPHLSDRYDFVGLFSRKLLRKIKHMLKIHGIKAKITKNVSGHGDTGAKELYVTRGFGRLAMALMGATFQSSEV